MGPPTATHSHGNPMSRPMHSIPQTPITKFVILVITLSILQIIPKVPNFSHALQQQVTFSSLQPYFNETMDSLEVKENTPVDEVIYTLKAQIDYSNLAVPSLQQQQNAVGIVYNIEGTNLFSVNRTSGQVRIAQPIDREQIGDSLTVQVSATPYFMNRPGTPAQISVTVHIIDENDNPPRIERVRLAGRNQEYDQAALSRSAYNYPSTRFNFASNYPAIKSIPVIRLNVSESMPAESVIVDLIEAIDVDKASSNPLSAKCLGCEPEFELRTRTANSLNDRSDWSLVLVGQLQHVPKNNIRQLHVVVTDGKYNSSLMLEVTIDDVQNKPPQFIGSTTCIVRENVPIDKTIMTIQAIDGDVMGSDDGASLLQRASQQEIGGRQIIYDFVDADGRSSSQQADFKLHPLTGQIQVANRLDREAYLATGAVLSLQVRARELNVDFETITAGDDLYESILSKLISLVDPSDEATSTAEVTVILIDVNDNAPHWLNSSEIAALNANRSPDWHNDLPSDRDTGRLYQFQIAENSPVGSVLTRRNEIFVYDLDNGENAEFNITVEDPFNLFDVEPKRVSGFASISLQLSPQPRVGVKQQAGTVLDYENINERSFIIQLHATEIKTNELFKSKAQIQVNVLDVNDNAPEFKELTYIANVREDAPAGKIVKLVQATDKDEVSKVISYSLRGKSSYLFDIDAKTGLITVANCSARDSSLMSNNLRASPSRAAAQYKQDLQQSTSSPKKQCIDYELQRSHHLMVEASDGELSTAIPLTIFIDDVSDNAPVFSLPIVDVVIEEGSDRLDPPIKVEATDIDQSSILSYSIVEGNFEGLFSINNLTGELQLTRPIRIAHDDLSSSATEIYDPEAQSKSQSYQAKQQLNKMTLIVQASDGLHTANGTVRIDVLDANDNSPKFMRSSYEKEITESYSPGQSVLTVRAFDLDRGNNAKVSYRIERGSHNQFEINEDTGEIYVAPSANAFNVSRKENYTLEVVAYDHGLVQKNSSVQVEIRVLGTNKRAPEFSPPVQRATISENTLNNTIIHRMSIIDSAVQLQQRDLMINPVVIVFEPGPIEALDKNGQPVVDTERLESMFSVSTNTGDVAISSALDHDFAAHVNLTIFASYRSLLMLGSGAPSTAGNLSIEPSPVDRSSQVEEFVPRATGFLIINVVDDNTNPPIFAAPWTASQPELSFQMNEELPAGSILTQLVASDADSRISHFKIEPSSEYFELTSPQSGVIVTRKPIDYDALMRQNFLTPSSHRLSSQQIAQQSNNILQFNVFVYDSGLPQLSAKAIVSVEILPVNDWDCKFEQQVYEAHISENSPPDMVVTQVRANDLDYGEQHNTVHYQLIGEQKHLFNIDQRTGVITVSYNGSLNLDRESLSESILLTVIGRDEVTGNDNSLIKSFGRSQRDESRSARSCSTTLKVHIDDINDNPPLFTQKIYEVTAYDTDVIDVPLIKLMVKDDDSSSGSNESSGSNGRPTFSFRILSGNFNDSFRITEQGMLHATKILVDSYSSIRQPIELRVQVRQQSAFPAAAQGGMPATSFTDECLVRVNLFKVNRYAPEWRSESLKSVAVEENKKPGTQVTQLKCVDRDYQDRKGTPAAFNSAHTQEKSQATLDRSTSAIRYYIKENGTNVLETSEFRLDSVTGLLTTRVELDRERRDFYQLIISCEDNGKPQSLDNITPLFISVLDVDDNRPEFSVPKNQKEMYMQEESSYTSMFSNLHSTFKQETYRDQDKPPVMIFKVEEHQSKGLQIGELKATDRDLNQHNPIYYCIIEGNENREFHLDQMTGILYTRQSLDRERQHSYNLLIRAANDGSSCEEISTTNATNFNQRREHSSAQTGGLLIAHIDVLDINDNAPIFKRQIYRAGVHHRSLINTLVTQISAHDPDLGSNGTLAYRITEILMYKTNPVVLQQPGTRGRYDISNEREAISKPIKLIQSPFRIDQNGYIFTHQLLTQYQLMSMFVLSLEATEQSEPWRTVTTKLEIYIYETNSQLKIRINLHPRLVDTFKYEIETLMSNATKYSAIINRGRSYHGGENLSGPQANNYHLSRQQSSIPTLNLSPNQVPPLVIDSNEPSHSNVYLIFVDNYRIVNPNLVIEKFDLTSAQLFTAKSLTQQYKSNSNDMDSRQLNDIIAIDQANDVTSLIDKIALASTQSNDHTSPSSLVGIDWLENPSILFVALSAALTLIGTVFCLAGCCCTSRIKDHIIKVAMDKLVKQQTLQAKINERVLAATNQSYANGNNDADAIDYMLQQGGLISSFDATKRCINNNYENMNLQRAMDSDEFIDPNYLTLNGHVNIGAHYYDASDIEQAGDQYHMDGNGISGKQTNESTISLSMIEDESGDHPNKVMQDDMLDGYNSSSKDAKLYTNGTNGIVSSHSRLRQQVPPSNK